MWLDPLLFVEIALEIRSNLVYLPVEIIFWLVTGREETFLDRSKLHRGKETILPIKCIDCIEEGLLLS